jgi:O-succinylbenzoic acid--CoA ligase
VLATYGLTETFGQIATAARPGAPLVALPGVELAAGTPGAPAPIRIRAATLATCYLDGAPIAPELTTHDLGVLDGGALRVLGRADDVIITGGENVHPAQVEAVLAATPGVRAACAFGVPDARWGQIVGAALAVAPAFDRAAALARWHAQLPPHARPRRLALAAALPLLPSGKVDRRAAAALGAEPVAYTSSDEA